MDMQQLPQHRVSRRISSRIVFEHLLHKGPISRADLSKRTGLSKQTISEIIENFERQNWVHQIGRTSGNIGRTAVLYEIAPDAGYVIGVDVGGAKISAAIADISCEIKGEITEATDKRGGHYVLDQVAALARKLVSTVNADVSKLRSLVVGTPGVANPSTGGIELAPNIPDLAELDVLGSLRAILDADVSIENDVNLALLGEIWQGCAQHAEHVAFVALGNGIGLGLSVNGQLIRGETGFAGEIGFLPLGGDPYRPEVRGQGSLEHEIGSAGVLRRFKQRGGAGLNSAREVFERCEQGDRIALEVIDESARLLALAITSVSVLFDPKLIVMGGSIGVRPELIAGVKKHLEGCAPRPVDLRTSALDNRAGVLGALAVSLNHVHEDLFGVPQLAHELPLPSPKAL